ncbi:MAG TPA: FG-GAP repeat protein [Candidatus Binatia bacterium]|jgi:hypothetical protein|nr:FG-GAP repeat protein [Candidatus Binatia bacterium]
MTSIRTALVLATLMLPPAGVHAASLHADFNGDGFADLAVGVEGENVGAILDAGAVQVVYGSVSGLTGHRSQRWHQDVSGIADNAEPQESFGRGLATGDFDGDGFADLVIGVPGESIGGVTHAGAVQVLYGAARGLAAKRSQLWHQDSPGIADRAEVDDYFGGWLTTGDFDADGFADLAIGVQAENLGRENQFVDAGALHILYGTAAGLTSARSAYWTQGSNGLPESPETKDYFGSGLSAGDFDADGFDDLVVAAPGEDHTADPAVAEEGVVYVLRGSASGLTAADEQRWEQDSPGLAASVLSNGRLGSLTQPADFNADGFDDLVIWSRTSVPVGAGAIDVLYGSAWGLRALGHTYLTADTPGVDGVGSPHDGFGAGLAAGDFNGDGFPDLAAGAYDDDAAGLEDAGAVHVFWGTPAGLHAFDGQHGFDDRYWHQATHGMDGDPTWHGSYGYALAAADYDGNGYADLAVGVAGDTGGAGAVHVLYGGVPGLSGATDVVWTQNSPQMPDTAESGDQFGGVLAR